MRTLTEMVPMRDGIHLCTNVYLPDADKKYAVILARNPYVLQNDEAQIQRDGANSAEFVNHDFIVVYQHCRGKGSSEGVFYPFCGEREDGLDTIAWIEKQPWCNGDVYLWGGSYLSYVHLSYLDALPASVRGAALAVMCDDPADAFYKGGAYKADLLPIWYTGVCNAVERVEDPAKAYREHWRKRPAADYTKYVFGSVIGQFNDLFLCGRDGAEACPGSFSQAAHASEKVRVPVLFLDGWSEMFFSGMAKMWDRLPAQTRERSAFVVGPWSHGDFVCDYWKYPFTHGNDKNFGRTCMEWFLHLRDGTPLSMVTEGKLNYYHAGKDAWETSDTFPVGKTVKRFFLSPEGLSDSMPAGGQWNYTFDPDDPAEFPGGPNTFCTGEVGHAVQPAPDFRSDVKSFMTEPLSHPLDMAGVVRASLVVGSDCPASMFLCRLSVVAEDGTATLIQDGPCVVDSFQSGQPRRIFCDMGPVCWQILPGQRLRLDVTSSDAHSYRVHTNTQGDWWEQTQARVAHNSVYFGDSVLEIPVND